MDIRLGYIGESINTVNHGHQATHIKIVDYIYAYTKNALSIYTHQVYVFGMYMYAYIHICLYEYICAHTHIT